MPLTNAEYVAGLRAAADFFEQHPDLTIPSDSHVLGYSHDAERMAAVAAEFGEYETTINGTTLVLSKEVAPGFVVKYAGMLKNMGDTVKTIFVAPASDAQ